jgi:tRNA(fMet)-specific endonuclease VapC
MKYVIDTDTIIYYLKGKQSVVDGFLRHFDTISTTMINVSELYFGAYNSEKIKQNLKTIKEFTATLDTLEFCEKSAEIFGEQKAKLKVSGTIIADMDLMIASIAIANKHTLVTNNTKHFERIEGLKLDNWTVA